MTAATYGELLNEALLEIAAAWQEPPRFAAGAEAVAAAQARTRLNRGAARALRRYTTEPWFATPARDPVRGRGESHQPHLQGLAAELATSAGATAGVLDLPAGPVRTTARPGSLAGRLTRAAEAADGAWDLLASHLTGDGQPRTPAGETVRGRLARALATDALLLARGVAGLDTRLGLALCRTALDPATGALTRPALLHVAEDCLRHQRQTPARHRPAVRRRGRRRPARHRLDLDRQHRPGPAATAGPAGQPRAGRRRGRQVPHVAGRPRRRTAIADLVTLAATAFRLISIIGQLADPTAWRRCHHNLRLLRTVHPAPAGCTHAVLLAGWTDRQLRGGVPTKPAHPAWTTWTDAAAVIADRLPDLANAAATSLDLLASRRQLLISGPRKDRYRWRAPRTALPAAPRPPQSTLEPHRPGRTR